MFYAHFVLAKKGPLARIWLAAHWDKKLTKAQVYETNIEESVVGIMQPKVKMALRTSGHLLLGVVKIYSRKAKYLLADCNEAFAKIKMAFRPGMVDLPMDKREAAINAITLPDYFNDVDTEVPTLDSMVDFMDGGEFMMMSHTRADEITLRENYAGVMLEDEPEGFDGSMEIMRDAGQHQRGSGSLESARISMDQDMSRLRDAQFGFESSIERPSLGVLTDKESQYGSNRPTSDAMSGIFAESGLPFNASVQGTLDNVGLQGPPSPGNSIQNGGVSRPITPLGDTGLEAIGGSEAGTAAGLLTPPSLNATPSVSHPVSAPPPPTPSPAPTEPMAHGAHHDQTTLLQNEDESFALAPIDASALQKGGRRKRKRKLVVDEIKAFTGEEMKARLEDSSDLVTTLDIAPPTKRLMHWTAIGGVEELFSLPCHPIHKGAMLDQYKKGLKVHNTDDEHFTFVIDHPGADLQLQHISPDKRVERVRGSATKMRPAKRKRQDILEESSYAKRQQDLVRQQEEFAREFREQNISLSVQEDLMQVSGVEERLGATDFSNLDDLPPPATPSGPESPESLLLPPSPSQCLPCASLASPLQTDSSILSVAPSVNISLQLQQNTRRSSRLAEPRLTFDSEPMAFEAPSFAPMSPADVPLPLSPDFDDAVTSEVDDYPVVPAASVVDDYPAVRAASAIDDYPAIADASAVDDYPAVRAASVVDDYPAVPNHSEVYDITADDYPVDDREYSDGEVSFTRVREASAGRGNVTEQSQMFDDESVEAYETRVLNKRAVQLHKVLDLKFKEADNVDFSSLVTEKQNRKHVAQSFYSFLVLNKHDALTGTQETIFAPLVIQQTPGFHTAIQRL